MIPIAVFGKYGVKVNSPAYRLAYDVGFALAEDEVGDEHCAPGRLGGVPKEGPRPVPIQVMEKKRTHDDIEAFRQGLCKRVVLEEIDFGPGATRPYPPLFNGQGTDVAALDAQLDSPLARPLPERQWDVTPSRRDVEYP